MVVKRKVCDLCKYHVCSEEEFLSASKEQRAKYNSKWYSHINSTKHHLERINQYKLQEKQLIEGGGKEKVFDALLNEFIATLNKKYDYLLPDGLFVKGISLTYYDKKTSDACRDILKLRGFLSLTSPEMTVWK